VVLAVEQVPWQLASVGPRGAELGERSTERAPVLGGGGTEQVEVVRGSRVAEHVDRHAADNHAPHAAPIQLGREPAEVALGEHRATWLPGVRRPWLLAPGRRSRPG
jgi:hypothetical protein